MAVLLRQIAGACCALAVSALALLAGPAAAAPAPSSDPAATGYLDRIKRAARELDYAGVFIYQQGQVMLSSQMAHLVDGSGEHQRVEILDGRAHREFLRHNDQVRTLFPELRILLLEQREIEHFPAFYHGDPAALAEHYTVDVEAEPGRVAGRPCLIAHVNPRGSDRWGYRLCADVDSGLLLKAQTIDADGQVLEQVAFSEVRFGPGLDPALVKPGQDVSGWREVPAGDPVNLAAEGWRISAPPGFAPISEIQRTLKHDKSVRQIVLSDGVAAISVFIESYLPSHEETAGAKEHGATSIFCRRLGDYWLTVMGEVPAGTVRQVAEAITFEPRAP